MAKKNLENKLLAVVRVRGRAGTRQSVTETLNRLNLRRVNNLVLVFGTKSNIGMIHKCNDFVTFGEIQGDILAKLIKSKELPIKAEAQEELMKGKITGKDVNGISPIRMHPPKRGYEGIKRAFVVKGALGYRGEKINDLIKRMM
ncbi:MAG: uL30 family ribosomal protein [Candidatus Micrarchaeota archaeon]|nr:uL30 family ribosomal protein [Candidatus Micrarchaeota archaeon]